MSRASSPASICVPNPSVAPTRTRPAGPSLAEWFERVLGELEPEDVQLLRLTVMHGLSLAVCAIVLGATKSTVAFRCARAVRRLRDRLVAHAKRDRELRRALEEGGWLSRSESPPGAPSRKRR